MAQSGVHPKTRRKKEEKRKKKEENNVFTQIH